MQSHQLPKRVGTSQFRKKREEVLNTLSKIRKQGGRASDYYSLKEDCDEDDSHKTDDYSSETGEGEATFSISEIKKMKRPTDNARSDWKERKSTKRQAAEPTPVKRIDSAFLFPIPKSNQQPESNQVEKSQKENHEVSRRLVADELLKELDSSDEEGKKEYTNSVEWIQKSMEDTLEYNEFDSAQVIMEATETEQKVSTENTQFSPSSEQNLYKKSLSNSESQNIDSMNLSQHEEEGERSYLMYEHNSVQNIFQADSSHYVPCYTENDEIRFFWYDIEEAVSAGGSSLFLFGKALFYESDDKLQQKDGKSRQILKNVCLHLPNLDRVLYFAPRWDTLQQDSIQNENDAVELIRSQVFPEVQQITTPLVPRFFAKPVTRIHPFLDDPRVPKYDAYYLKVKYPFKYAPPSKELAIQGGKTFNRIFGTTTTAIERLLLKKKLKGPGWLRLKNATISSNMPCSLKCCLQVENIENIVLEGKNEVPVEYSTALTFSILCLSFVFQWNEETSLHEIIAVTGIFYPFIPFEFFQSSVLHSTLQKYIFSIIRPLKNQSFPPEFEKMTSRSGHIETVANEAQLLHNFLEKLSSADPDIILGHDLQSFQLDILLHRLAHLQTPNWSIVGRLKRSKKLEDYLYSQKNSRQERTKRESYYYMKTLFSGRLIADTLIASKELLPRETNYGLSHLAKSTGVDTKLVSLPDARQTQTYFSSAQNLRELLDLNTCHAAVSFQLCCKLAALSLSLELAYISGYLWSNCLFFTRAERVEILLAHAFKELFPKAILPDKLDRSKKELLQLVLKSEKAEEQETVTEKVVEGRTSKRKAKYEGGLVLEPKRGLYDSLILQLDFNSLYPSIIQEYNLCFTTTILYDSSFQNLEDVVIHTKKKGVLPLVLEKLVQRRREVKDLKQKTKDINRQQQLNIEQAALKLTANSVYGCLGAEHSRFGAQTLAALVTQFGRVTLDKTIKIAERCGFEVIYGDTDSMFLNTGVKELDAVLEKGRVLKHEVNRNFRSLEIDVEAIYTRMLLLQKKHYAAMRLVDPVSRPGETILEVKGVEMVRHDWCPASRELSLQVVELLLSSKFEREECVHKVISCLRFYIEQVRQGNVPLEKFVITKSLTQKPSDYSNDTNNPHVEVAKRLICKGFPLRTGSYIPYVMCKRTENGYQRTSDTTPVPYHPSELDEAAVKLSIDTEWYIDTQLLPPVLRLCEPAFDEAEKDQLLEACGISTATRKSSGTHSYENCHIFQKIDAAIEKQTFLPWMICCPSCSCQVDFFEVTSTKEMKANILKCMGCDKDYSLGFLVNSLHKWLRCLERQYYDSFWSHVKRTEDSWLDRKIGLRKEQLYQTLLELLCRLDSGSITVPSK
ncbi:DNA polymerase alpha subunit A [Galdieria sulphuraria]|uniref:DNA polymerase n=1 Tax=Galdieria sulphuraria TaxID=130081 RepID=M2Y4S7_GALSU|nr:DNA polymerase alpha subunit A [Galdieria sulphuraria]EME30849.1 DNA polymerase alpha subunit A [Galdieria sulphuraria]|eukprot:XP_005707369.1 DNA polymerase alpha subunit A [Galdieria sulphuraria]